MELKQELKFHRVADIVIELQETIEIKQKVQSGKREYYNQSNHYCLHEGCYWRKKLPAQE